MVGLLNQGSSLCFLLSRALFSLSSSFSPLNHSLLRQYYTTTFPLSSPAPSSPAIIWLSSSSPSPHRKLHLPSPPHSPSLDPSSSKISDNHLAFELTVRDLDIRTCAGAIMFTCYVELRQKCGNFIS